MQNHEETIALIKKAQNGDVFAKNKLIEENAPLVKCLIKRYLRKGIEYDDLYQLGCLGFVKAINKFDEGFHTRFSTYAVPIILGEVKRHLRDDGYIKVSRTIKHQANLIKKYIDEYSNQHSLSPTFEQIAEQFDMELTDVVFCLESAKMPVSIYEKNDSTDKSSEMLEKLPTQESESKNVQYILLKDLICDLNSRDRKIIYLRYFKEYTQSEIAEFLGISQVQVSRIESKILSNLKEQLNY